MRLVVGLGNPGRKYEQTRHNIGFDVVAALVARFGKGTPRAKFDGEMVEADVGGERCLLVRPLTYMNESGRCVQPLRDFYKVENRDILVICDDLSLPVAKLRLRAKGSAGGQKGLDDILRRLGGDEIARLRVGIGAVPPGWDAADYVLGRFSSSEAEQVRAACQRATEAVADWVARGIEFCMNKYNAGG